MILTTTDETLFSSPPFNYRSSLVKKNKVVSKGY
jgi:hypothetical protein